MANTYTQIYIQIVFAPKYRESLIKPEWENDLHKYRSGILRNKGHKMLAINGMADHIHIFMGMKPSESLSKIVQDVKANSSGWINKSGFLRGKFAWQSGYGGFSYGHSQIDRVVKYIAKQKEHHLGESFRKEYLNYLQKFEIDFDDEYLFEFFD